MFLGSFYTIQKFVGSAEPILTKPPALKEQNVLDSKKAYVF